MGEKQKDDIFFSRANSSAGRKTKQDEIIEELKDKRRIQERRVEMWIIEKNKACRKQAEISSENESLLIREIKHLQETMMHETIQCRQPTKHKRWFIPSSKFSRRWIAAFSVSAEQTKSALRMFFGRLSVTRLCFLCWILDSHRTLSNVTAAAVSHALCLHSSYLLHPAALFLDWCLTFSVRPRSALWSLPDNVTSPLTHPASAACVSVSVCARKKRQGSHNWCLRGFVYFWLQRL